MPNTNFWLSLGGMAAVVSLLGAVVLWALRRIIREELEPMRQDIETLRMAAFNHLSHGQTPNEAQIRTALGYGKRGRR